MNVFVTGAAGFSGSNVVRYLLKAGHRVTAVSRNTPTLLLPFDSQERLILVRRDINMLDTLPVDTEAIVHSAATSPTTTTQVSDFICDNVLATDKLVRLARSNGVKKFIFLSSLSTFGEISCKVVDETTPIVNPGAYGASKLFGELSLREASPVMASIALRLPAILGRGAARHWLANTLGRALAGKAIHIYNPDALFNNAVFVDDLCVFIGACLEREWSGFDMVTLGADGQMPVYDIVSRIIAVTKSSSRVMVDFAPRHSFMVSSQRAKEVYGYAPKNFDVMLDLYLSQALA
jgi:UDP-glucose 4-epimerase